jgi:hypothetical protein
VSLDPVQVARVRWGGYEGGPQSLGLDHGRRLGAGQEVFLEQLDAPARGVLSRTLPLAAELGDDPTRGRGAASQPILRTHGLSFESFQFEAGLTQEISDLRRVLRAINFDDGALSRSKGVRSPPEDCSFNPLDVYQKPINRADFGLAKDVVKWIDSHAPFIKVHPGAFWNSDPIGFKRGECAGLDRGPQDCSSRCFPDSNSTRSNRSLEAVQSYIRHKPFVRRRVRFDCHNASTRSGRSQSIVADPCPDVDYGIPLTRLEPAFY